MKNSIFLLLLLCLVAVACNSEKQPTKVDSHEVINPIVKDTSYDNEYVAEIQSVKYVEVRSRIKGHIEKIHIDEGQAVKEGQLLFTLSFMEFEKELQKANAAHKSAQANLKAAEVELSNVKRLLEKNIVAGGELEVAKAKVEALRANMDEAAANKEQVALNLAFAQIKAPFSGFVNRIPNKVGSLIADGDMLTSISDNREVFAYFNLSEIDYLNYVSANDKHADSVSLKLANHTLYPHAGKIEMIESEFDHATGNIAFRARFPNPDALLKHGSNGKVVVNKQLKNALLVPQKSTFEIQDKLYVYVVNQDGVLQQRNIIPKMRFPDFYVVESGLSKEERIVYEGVETLKDGDKVQPKPVDLAQVMPSSDHE
ncbi:MULTISPECIES: efflux RND transporter periplasmic adaptor subunit [Methylomonas]|uniref:Efflux transporter periplasmic adaptor subunit n=2 Tax=Methylomonas TaxID=416 RepID=A0A126T4N9_9GAMM|nr:MULTISPECIES: efflux RND transporter periplasmic adaptor subunit [Methylomonas]AMK77053.1 efflux transporter periplasmic adaptor subunit [Methylomonas denitrificans]OAH96238.1 efflux transporter periplasmic adaptor subunit [Methylomonas methanica]TCV76891.1 membrane fusion protein (multidrug efflux system) [Methylomonas methanica]